MKIEEYEELKQTYLKYIEEITKMHSIPESASALAISDDEIIRRKEMYQVAIKPYVDGLTELEKYRTHIIFVKDDKKYIAKALGDKIFITEFFED